ncbi:MAG: tetratricopeptide repeat protein [Holosporales bacterium]|jgi:hypothetical protein|nr:tetratricopeptide repeat protein [Holosporales bacterium]
MLKMKDKKTKGDTNNKDVVFDEFLNDIENDMRIEKYELLWKKYGKLLSFVAFAVIAAITIFNLRLRYNANQREEFASQFMRAQTLVQQGKLDEAVPMMSFLSSKKCGKYTVLAKMSHAGLLTKINFSENIETIKGIYKNVLSDRNTPAYYRDLATVYYVNASLQEIGEKEIDDDTKAELLKLLSKCKKANGGFFLLAKEFEGVIHYKTGNFKKARKAFDTISRNEKTAEDMMARANIMIQAIQNKIDDDTVDSEED